MIHLFSVDSVAQLVEQYTFNVWVLGSSPSGITKLRRNSGLFFAGLLLNIILTVKSDSLEPKCTTGIQPPTWHLGTQQITITGIGEIGTFQLNAEKSQWSYITEP